MSKILPNLNNNSSTQLEINNIDDSNQNDVNNNPENQSYTRIKIKKYMQNPQQHNINTNIYEYKIINDNSQNNMNNQELNFQNIGSNTNNFNNNNFNNNYNNNFNNNYNNNLINNINQNITDTIRSSDNGQSNLIVLKSIDNMNLISLVKMICLSCIHQTNILYNLEDLRNNIQNQLLKLDNKVNWYVKITIQQLTNFGNINYDSIIIFEYKDSIQKFFIHVAQLL